jgi:four helix bundle protein
MPTSPGFRGLRVYQLAFKLAMEIYHESKHFPVEEKYSLTDQICRASRSVAGNIGEGYRRKRYPKVFVNKMSEADGEATVAYACGYISKQRQSDWIRGYEEIGRMLGGMIGHPERFTHLSRSCRLLLPPAPIESFPQQSPSTHYPEESCCAGVGRVGRIQTRRRRVVIPSALL